MKIGKLYKVQTGAGLYSDNGEYLIDGSIVLLLLYSNVGYSGHRIIVLCDTKIFKRIKHGVCSGTLKKLQEVLLCLILCLKLASYIE